MVISTSKKNGDLYQQKERFMIKVVNQSWIPVVDELKKRYQHDLSRYTFTTREKFFEDFGIRFTHQSNKIEGSTLDLKDVRGVIVDIYSRCSSSSGEKELCCA